jgi:hypothetical protein
MQQSAEYAILLFIKGNLVIGNFVGFAIVNMKELFTFSPIPQFEDFIHESPMKAPNLGPDAK